MKYDSMLAKRIRNIPKPADFTMDIAQSDSGINLLVYDTEILKFDVEARKDIMWYLLTVRNAVRDYGVPCEIKGLTIENRG